MTLKWLEYVKRLHAIGATGQHFTAQAYDRERYDEIVAITTSMLAELASQPVERLANLLPHASEGYATPKLDVRGAVIRDGQVLLVREVEDGLWALPGGYTEVGLSARQNVEKEVLEEAGIKVSATALYAVRHKSKNPYTADVRDFYKLFFICEGEGVPKAGPEALEVGFFAPTELPPLSRGRTIEKDITEAIRFQTDPSLLTVFD